MKIFLMSYFIDGMEYGSSFYATDWEEAEKILPDIQPDAILKGELVETIQAGDFYAKDV